MDKVVHFEIPFDNKERAIKFYKEIFGWGLQDLGPQMGDYVLVEAAQTDADRMVQDKGAINGGLSRRDDKNSVPRVYIQVDRIEDAFERIEAAGGQVLQTPMPIPNGRMAVFADPEGNSVGLVDAVKTEVSEEMANSIK